MKNLMRAVIAGAASIAAVAATTVPAHAYYRLVSDPSGDLETTGRCAKVPGALALDAREMSATVYKDGHVWRMSVTLRMADLPKPKARQYTSFNWYAYRHGDVVFSIRAERTTFRGKVTIDAEAFGSGSDPAAPGTLLKAKTRGNTLKVWGLRMKPGNSFRVKATTEFQQFSKKYNVVCSAHDTTRKSATLRTSE